jgi:hypothetical protein
MFEILEALSKREPHIVPKTTPALPALTEIRVCAFSGDRASSFCPVTRTVWGMRHRVPMHTCRFHKQILRDVDSGRRVFRGCDQGLHTELASVLDLPASVLTWMRTSLRHQALLPPFHPQCTSVPVAGGALAIRSPGDGQRYLLLPSFGQHTISLPLDLQISGTLDDVSCFLNGRQLAFGRMAFGRVLQLGPGVYHLFCSNLDGASHDIHFAVTAPSTLPRLRR